MRDDMLLATLAHTPEAIHPSAWVGHLPFGYWLVSALRPAMLVELGTHTGESYFSFCQAVLDGALETRCHAVDTWEGDAHAGYYGNDIFIDVSARNDARYAAFSRLIRARFDDALADFPDGSVDLLHIDGLHTYEAVKHDFETWLPKLMPGAIVLFHDTCVFRGDFGVHRLWQELCAQYPRHLSFTHSAGLGVLQLPGGTAGQQLDILVPGPAQDMFVLAFEKLGKPHELNCHIKLGAFRTVAEVELDIRVRQMEASTSWRVTAPLRSVGALLGRLKRQPRGA